MKVFSLVEYQDMPEVKIRINDDRELSVATGDSLYAALTGAGIFIPSACGGRGGCGLCGLKIIEGTEDQPLTSPELHWLKEDVRAAGVRLSCQVKVLKDLRIAIPAQMLGVRQYKAQVMSMRDLTYDIKEVRLKLLNPPEIGFRSGQYVQIQIPAYELTRRPIFRAYSLAGDPSQKGELDLEVRYVPNGISTTYIHKHLREGDTVDLNGPHGNFYLRDGARDIVMIAGGSGMAPIKSILLDMAGKHDSRKAQYFFGAKALKDLFLVDLMRDMEKRLQNFRFIPALSEPLPGDDWKGETGLITEVVDRHIEDASGMDAYLCGSPLMVDACLKVLRAKGIPEDHIFYDKFT